ncbi:septation protein SepH [Euzebya tangerina]|uniref:septation protein SepH n=1 Tax=Euzebya tangerina TaxID=591198 RepID=UPI000E311A0B|nr:septation protein SepH [Euzebya tangerina]
MHTLELVGYTADLTSLVLAVPGTGERFRVDLSTELMSTLVEVLELAEDHERLELLADLVPLAQVPAAGQAAVVPFRSEGRNSSLTPSEIQRMLRAGRSPETVADQAGVSREWVMRWYQPIAAEQRKVISSVRGGRQERPGFGLSDTLIGEAVRMNLMERGVEDEDVEWQATRPEGRPYWTVTVVFTENRRPQKATWRYDIGTGRVTARDDLAIDLGWTMPVTHPTPGVLHAAMPEEDEEQPRPTRRAAPPPPPRRDRTSWAPPSPPSGPRRR